MMPVKATLSGRRVLVVEDEMLVALFIADALAGAGCEVVGMTARIDEALALIDDGSVDMAVLDVNLGRGCTSFPIADALATRDIPFLFSTGYGAQPLGQSYPDRSVLTKPFREEELVRALSDLVTSH